MSFTLAARNVQQGAAVYMDGRRVDANLSVSSVSALITLKALPLKGSHWVQLQNPAGLFSNEYLIRIDTDAKSGDFNLQDALLRGDDRLALSLLEHGAPINNLGDEGSTAVY